MALLNRFCYLTVRASAAPTCGWHIVSYGGRSRQWRLQLAEHIQILPATSVAANNSPCRFNVKKSQQIADKCLHRCCNAATARA